MCVWGEDRHQLVVWDITLSFSRTHKHMHVWEKLMELKRRWLKLLWAGLMLYVKVCAIAQWEWKKRWWVQDMNVEEEERRYVWIIPISLWSEHMNARAKCRLQESKNDMENTKLKPLSVSVELQKGQSKARVVHQNPLEFEISSSILFF